MTITDSTTGDETTTHQMAEDILSTVTKKELIRLKREDYWALKKKQKKEAIKERKKLTATSQSPATEINKKGDNAGYKKTKEEMKQDYTAACQKSFTVIIDCDFENHHNDRPLRSLAQQIAFCYGINKRHTNPSLIQLSGVGEKLKTQLMKSNAQSWLGFHISDICYSAMAQFGVGAVPAISDDSEAENQISRVKQLVYLTSDSSEILESLDDSCAYIIGDLLAGIVDRNSLKGLTYKKATDQGIRTAKLPIREHMALTGSHVLTVNQVFEILLVFKEIGSWKDTLERTMPKRKEKDNSKRKRSESCDQDVENGDDSSVIEEVPGDP